MLALIDIFDAAIVALILLIMFRPLFRRPPRISSPFTPTGRPFRLDLRFQFRLRSLMIVVTLLAPLFAYIAWQARIVNERRVVLAEIENLGGGIMSDRRTTAGFWNRFPNWPSEAIESFDRRDEPRRRAQTTIRRMLGDETMLVVWLPASIGRPEEVRIRQSIPEADIWRFK